MPGRASPPAQAAAPVSAAAISAERETVYIRLRCLPMSSAVAIYVCKTSVFTIYELLSVSANDSQRLPISSHIFP